MGKRGDILDKRDFSLRKNHFHRSTIREVNDFKLMGFEG